ncbi:hypothetical protein Tco_1151437 [Tanacetum coccineum]
MEEMGMSMDVRLSMEYSDAQGHVVFTSHAWRRLFEIRGSLLGGARRQMSWRQFILDLGLHTTEEINIVGFKAYWDESSRIIIKDPLRRHAEGRKWEAQMSWRHFIRRLDDHFGLLTEERLQGMTVIGGHLAWVALGPERQQVAAAGAPKDVEGAHAEVEGDQAIPAPVQAPQPPPTVA